MTFINRRRFVGGTVAAAAASSVFSMPAIIRAQNAPVEIDFYHIWGTPPGQQAPGVAHPSVQVIDLFNESQSDIHVNSVTVGNYIETMQKVQAELAAGNAPALMITPWAFLYVAREGLGIQNLAETFGDDVNDLLDNLNPDVHSLVTTESGEVLGVPYAFSTPVWYYNAEVLEQAGVTAEEAWATWENVAEAAPAIQEVLGEGNPVFSFTGNMDWPAQTIIQSNGGFILENGAPAMNSDVAIEAMQTIANLDASGFHDRSVRADRRGNWMAGASAFMMSSVASLRGIRGEAPFEFGTVPFPKFGEQDRVASAGGSFIGMYAREEEQQNAAWEFMKFALTEDAYKIWAEVGYLNITNLDLPILDGQEAAYTQYSEGLTSETQWPGERGAEASGVWDVYCERIWSNDISAEEGANAAVEEVNMILGL